ncbi:hypothetical protein [Campylobacter sp. RM12651]|uniref:hypothetical protein n=1 Tax=Campylobacter sp. RM12651 TaxID=1660079 RepID=UPI001EFBC717|nr:hypothetical protein [Campylobacter sp. RM12651]ULO03819.1 hypothetical protein AVBRAN_1365 [Campylobacter sp. RM12651]
MHYALSKVIKKIVALLLVLLNTFLLVFYVLQYNATKELLEKQMQTTQELEYKIDLLKEENKQQKLFVEKYKLQYLKIKAHNEYLDKQIVNKEKYELEEQAIQEQIKYMQMNELTLN